MGRSLSIGLVVLALAAGGCGGDEGEVTSAGYVPAAGSETPTSTPGVPPGASYDATAAEWLKLGDGERRAASKDLIADNPDACEGADPVKVVEYAEASAGTDYPLNAPVHELLAEGCAADLQGE